MKNIKKTKNFKSNTKRWKTKLNSVRRHPSGKFDFVSITNEFYKGDLAIITDNKISADTIFNDYSNVSVIISGTDGIYLNKEISEQVDLEIFQKKLSACGVWGISDNQNLLREKSSEKQILDVLIEKVMNQLLFTKCVCEKCGNYSYIGRTELFWELEKKFQYQESYFLPEFQLCDKCNQPLCLKDFGIFIGTGRGFIGDTVFSINSMRYRIQQNAINSCAIKNFKETGNYGNVLSCNIPFLYLDLDNPIHSEKTIVIEDCLFSA